jgi:beta-glucosidase/6-phospho-beta-glucosidase/beta-galactosidase
MSNKKFHENFVWNVASAAYQIEGGQQRGVKTVD